MKLNDFLSDRQSDKMHWGEAISLWNIARFKILGLTISEIFVAQAKDRDLIKSLNQGVELLIVPHIEKIQKLMHVEGLEVPTVPQRKNLDVVGKNIEPNTLIQDDEIANNIREVYRFGLALGMRGVTDSTRDDVRGLIWQILSEDCRGFDAMIKLHRQKNWLIPPPTV